MKKMIRVLVLGLCCFVYSNIYSQNIGYQMLVGSNFCQIDGDQMGGYNKLGFRLGFGSFINTPKGDEIGLEITFCQKGSRTANNPDNPPPFIVRYNYNYLEVPLYYEKKLKNFGLRFALAPAYLVSARADLGGGFTDQTNVRKLELSGIIGPSYKLNDNLSFYAHYQYSIASIINLQKSQVAGASFRRTGVYNNVISAGFHYHFK